MKASQPAASFGSSKPFITGIPVVIPATEWFDDNLYDIIDAAATEAEQAATEYLQDRAESTPGWSVISDQLHVEMLNGEVTVGQKRSSKELSNYISDLEYGVEEQPPSPLLRKTLARVTKTIPASIHRSIEQDIPIA
jgi:hypothetical protein